MLKYRLELHTNRRLRDWWWTLRASNGKALAHSEMYKTRRAAMDTARNLAYALRIDVDDCTKVSGGNS